jgi:hypothetical protein
MADASKKEPLPILMGTCYMGPCCGQEFQHQADMKRVKVRDRDKPPGQHVYEWHEGLSGEQGKPVFLWEKAEGWRVGG